LGYGIIKLEGLAVLVELKEFIGEFGPKLEEMRVSL
jgi:hypothetical protein